MKFEEGDIVLCTVERIDGTNVFVTIEVNGEGIIMTSEIAAGRIRNLRDYVVPKKKIVCKVLRVSGNRVDLSLRRVTQKEQKEILEQYKTEKSYMSVLRTILGENAEEIIKKISEKDKLSNFLEEAKNNPKILEDIVGKENAKRILDITGVQKEKNYFIKKVIILKSLKPNGADLIKKILEDIKNAEVKYISAGHYSIKTESSEIKNADNLLKKIISEVEKSAKKQNMEFDIIEK
jgi:translation initiation factor 2 alpha subunit (eIF-2alpha)